MAYGTSVDKNPIYANNSIFIIKNSSLFIVDFSYFTTKHQSIGVGIKLSLAAQIITKKHNGNIKVTNTEFAYKGKLFKGTCIRIYFS